MSAGSRVQALARRMDCTEGQLYTAVIGLAVAVPFAVFGVPPTLRQHPASAATAPPAAPSPVVVPTPASALTPAPGLVTVPPPGPTGFGPPASPVDVPSVPSAPEEPPSPEPPSPAPVATAVPNGTLSVFARVGQPGSPAGVAWSPDGSVTVTTDNASAASTVLVYGRDGRLRRRVPVTGQPAGHTAGLVAAAADATGRVVVLDAATNRVLALGPGAAPTVRATIPDVAPCLGVLRSGACQPGLQDRPAQVAGVAVDAKGTVYVADAGQGIVWRLRTADRAPQVWYSAADLDTGDGPSGLAFDRTGRLLLTSGTSYDPAAAGNGGLYQLTLGADGAPATRTLVHGFALGERPGPLVLGASGTAYVVLRGTGEITSYDRSGTETGRITAKLTAGPVPLDGPAGLALAPGRLFVTNRAPGRPQHWAVLAVAVSDRP